MRVAHTANGYCKLSHLYLFSLFRMKMREKTWKRTHRDCGWFLEGWTTSLWPWGVSWYWCFCCPSSYHVLPCPTPHCVDSSSTNKILLYAFSSAPNTGIRCSHDALITVKVLNYIFFKHYFRHWKLPLRVHSLDWVLMVTHMVKLMPGVLQG